ncbi:single-stranded-DNA-specific exonuclease RecJ [Candidatus Chromulinivorax destructor]|uniref:Single-stranded-DNA-specific exonuclease RecJ n=1 Tax=Candidatus Chromulinivorax destructor TaxID=2066483 RepID=A0A345ZCI5_9BACT|nr:single-stranded-DNA-specific exonuclease RecJ [Candidatus Chromulinivorax destructor]AXK61002.1 single-stranded-DNA-specific exonuclease RecJ [Candidatus Chromulinivorax destructor]
MQQSMIQGKKYLWKLPQTDHDIVMKIAADYNLSFPLAQTLVARGFIEKEQLQDFILVSKEKSVHDPALMKDAKKAVDRLITAIELQEKILIFGDYDVDGITSSSLVMIAMQPLGAQINFFLPNRARDGYGLSVKIVERAAENGYKIIMTVDNGTTAFAATARAKELGIDVIITDHHRPHGHIPEVFALVNPHQEDCNYPYKYFAGVGVAFKLMSLLYQEKKLELPTKVIELLLLGTVADVVPLTGENRYWVRYGLAHINKHESYAIKVLKDNNKFVKPMIGSLDIGFTITPQINALGRLDDPRQGVKFLIGGDEPETDRIGKVLWQLNQARKDIELDIFQEVKAKIESNAIDLSKENIIIAASANWQTGVIGLVASRLVSAYGKPTLLFHLTKDGVAKGSCRSIPEFSIFDGLVESGHLLESFGGHAQAAGLAIKVEHLPQLKENLEKKIAAELTELDLVQKLRIDAYAKLPDFSNKFIADMAHLEPFGHQNSQPYFYIKDVVLVQRPTLMKDLHIKCVVFADGVIKSLIFFNRPELFEALVMQGDETFDIVAQVMQNYWNGKCTVELQGVDIARLRQIEENL